MFDPLTVAAIALKTSLLLTVVGLIAWLMSRQSAAWRHFLWAAALALALLMPIVDLCMPSYVQVSLPSQAPGPWTRAEPVPVASEMRRADPVTVTPRLREDSLPMQQRGARAEWPTAMIVWLIGALGVLLRNALAHVGLFRWVRKARSDLSPAWSATLSRVAREAGLRRPLRVLESEHTLSPCTWGVLRPVLLLPAVGVDWSEPQRRCVLLHEFAHVRRFDYLTSQVANLTCAMHWYNPFVWFAAARARKLQEQACDDAVLDAGGAPSDYAEFLVRIAAGSQRLAAAFPGAVGMAQRSQIHGRVIAILDASRVRLPLRGLEILLALVPLLCLTLLLATASAVSPAGAMQLGVPLTKPFSSVELRNGGKVFLIHGPASRVTLLKGDPEETGIVIRDDGRLVIDRCPKSCSHRHDLEVEVVAPTLTAIAVAEGGTIQSRAGFPPQPEIGLAVSQGGTIDIRPMAVMSVTAAVFSGGRIFVRPVTTLSANVERGGVITYWGDTALKPSIQGGGVIVEGRASDADRPLAELGPAVPAPPPTPPVPPVPALPPISR